MRKMILFLMILSQGILLWGQAEEPDKRPARKPFNSNVFNEGFTTQSLGKKCLQFDLEHRFGSILNGAKDVFGIYAGANMRLGLAYGFTDKLMLRAGLTKNFMIGDMGVQYRILQQTRSEYMPVSLTFNGNINIAHGNDGLYTKFVHRMSYFSQLSLSRKMNRLITVQISANYAHLNLIDTAYYSYLKHDNLGFSVLGKWRLTPGTLLLMEYDLNATALGNRPETLRGQSWYGKPNLSVGVEFATAGHSFQLFLSNYTGINPTRNMVYNEHAIGQGDFVIGFNLVRTWDFSR